MVGTWSNRRPCAKSLNPTGGLGALGTCQQAFRCISINYHKLVNHRAMINTPHLLLASDSSSRRGGGEGSGDTSIPIRGRWQEMARSLQLCGARVPGYGGLCEHKDWGTRWFAQTEARHFCKRWICWPFQDRTVLAGFGVCCRLGDLAMGLLAAATGMHRVNVSPRCHAGGEQQSLPPAAAASRWRLSFGRSAAPLQPEK